MNLELENSLLRVPFERLSNVFKNSARSLEKDIAQVSQSIKQLCSTTPASLSYSDSSAKMGNLITKLEALKKKLDEVNKQEELFMNAIQLRLEHLKQATRHPENRSLLHSRLNRMIVDYLLRHDLWDTASKFAETCGIKDLVEVELFISKAKRILDSLRKKDVQEALKFCSLNRPRLKKLGNLLELELRVQEFVELAVKDKIQEALKYAQGQLRPLGSESSEAMSRVTRGFSFLAFAQLERSEAYQEFMGPQRWTFLEQNFKSAFYQIYGLAPVAPLNLCVEIGLSAMKTPACGQQDNFDTNCAVCSPTGSALSISLPMAHYSHSTLVCPITKKVMDTENYPLVLPNGQVYSRYALEKMAEVNNGQVVCPRTVQQYPFESLKRAYIL